MSNEMTTDADTPYHDPDNGDLVPLCRDLEMDEMVEKLKAFLSQSGPWQWTRAAKDHEDGFGDRIRKNEFYYKRSIGAGWDEVVKLSRRSMDELLFAVFAGNPLLEELAEHVVEARQKQLRKIHDRFSPLQGL